MLQLIFEVVGLAVVIFAVICVILLIFSLFSCGVVLRYGRAPFPNFSLFVLNIFHEPLRRLLSFLGYDSEIVDKVYVEIANKANVKAFKSTAIQNRVLILPQCMRSIDCPAKLDAEEGIICVECGRCDISKIIAVCRTLNIRVYISPGGTFTRRILMRNRDKAVLGVACYPNLYEGALYVKIAKIPAQGVPLKRAGCVGTSVEVAEIFRKLLM